MISSPAESLALRMSSVAVIFAMANQIVESAKWRPGQILHHHEIQMVCVIEKGEYRLPNPNTEFIGSRNCAPDASISAKRSGRNKSGSGYTSVSLVMALKLKQLR